MFGADITPTSSVEFQNGLFNDLPPRDIDDDTINRIHESERKNQSGKSRAKWGKSDSNGIEDGKSEADLNLLASLEFEKGGLGAGLRDFSEASNNLGSEQRDQPGELA